MSEQEIKNTHGVVAILLERNGSTIAHASDFLLAAPGGFKLQEAQKSRAYRALALLALEKLSSPLLSSVFEAFEAEDILRKMCNKGDCKIVYISVGHDEE